MLEFLKLYIENGTYHSYEHIQSLIKFSSRYNHVNIMDYLYHRLLVDHDRGIIFDLLNSDEMLTSCIKHDNFDILRYLMEVRRVECDDHILDYAYYMKDKTMYNYLVVVREL